MINLSVSYYTEQQTDLAAIRKQVPDAAIYLEMCHCTTTGRRLTEDGGDNMLYRRTTDEQYYTAAHLAYARGADGVSAFNFVYYREHGTPGRGPFNEPPFHIFERIRAPGWLARQPQHYFLSDRGYANRQLPKKLESDSIHTFTMDMAPPEGGWKTDGKLRVQGRESLDKSQLAARFNGVDLETTSDVSEPYPNPYSPMLGKPEELRAWVVPSGLLKNGLNSIEISLIEGEPAEIIFLNLAVK